MYGGINTGRSSSSGAASAVADDTHLIYDDCPGSRALMAAAAKTQEQRQLYSFHSLPHYRQTSPGANPTIAQQAAQANSSLHQNAVVLPYSHHSANSTPQRRTTTSLSQNYLSDQQTSFIMTQANPSQSLRNTAPVQRKQTAQSHHPHSPHPLTPNNVSSHATMNDQLDNHPHMETRGILKESHDITMLQRRGSSSSGKRYSDVYGPSVESHTGSRSTLTGTGSGGVIGGSLSSRTESNTVVEKMDYQTSVKDQQGGGGGSTGSWRSSNKSATTRSQTSLVSASGGSFIMAQNKDSADEDGDEQQDDVNEEMMSSEDNLSQDSYELIEKDGELLHNNNDVTDLVIESLDNDRKSLNESKQLDANGVSLLRNGESITDTSNIILNHRKGSSHFEEEFYRQANVTVVSDLADTPPLIGGSSNAIPQSPASTKQKITDSPPLKPSSLNDEVKQEQTNSSSSKMSSRCSLNSSIILSPTPNVPQHKAQQQPTPVKIPSSPEQSSQNIKSPKVQDVSVHKPEGASRVGDIIKPKDIATSRLLTRVNSQDSFSQASAHNVTMTTTPGSTPVPQQAAIQGILTDTSHATDPSTSVIYDEFHGHEVNLHCHPQTPEERMMVDIVRNRGGLQLSNQQLNHNLQVRLRQEQQQQILQQQAQQQQQQLPPSYYSLHHKYHMHPQQYQQGNYEKQHSFHPHPHHVHPPQTHHSLPRQMYHQQGYQLVRQPSDSMHETLILQHPIARARYFTPKVYPPQQLQHYVQHPNQLGVYLPAAAVAQNQFLSRTLPNQRRSGSGGVVTVDVSGSSAGRTKSPVFFTNRNCQPGECSSGSSSSHASPRMSRPKSLEFTLTPNSGKNVQGITANRKDGVTIDPQSRMQQPNHEYDDSSSAISALMANEPHYYATSSSDVPQTPENPTTTILDTVKSNKQYYSEERIYDVPEGIEGVTDKIRIPTVLFSKEPGKSQSQLVPKTGVDATDLTSPSSSSGVNEAFPKPVVGKKLSGSKPSLPPPTTAPPPIPPNKGAASVESSRSSNHNGHLQQGYRSRQATQRGEIDQRKFHSLLTAIDQRDSIESCESTSIPKPSKNILGLRPRLGVLPLPTSRPMLLPTMSSTSTEDDPSLSARSAPTPVRDVEEIIDITKDEEDDEIDDLEDEEEDHYEKNSGTIKESKKKRLEIHKQIPQLSVNLISPPGESESSAAVLTSEAGVPAPPPEFSSSGPISNQDPREDTDVEDGAEDDDIIPHGDSRDDAANDVVASHGQGDDNEKVFHSVEYKSREDMQDGTQSASNLSKQTVVPNQEQLVEHEHLNKDNTLDNQNIFHRSILIEKTDGETDTIKRGKEVTTPPQSPIPRHPHLIRREHSIYEEEDIKIADMYVKVCGRNDKDEYPSSASDEGPSDTTSGTERNGETDPDNLPFIDAERKEREADLMENLDGLSCGGSSSRSNSRNFNFPQMPSSSDQQYINCLQQSPVTLEGDISNARRASEEISAEVGSHDEVNNALMQRLPSLPTGDSASSLNIENVSPIPPPLQLQDSIPDEISSEAPDDMFENINIEEKMDANNPDVLRRCRILSRISERSSSEEGPQRVIVNVSSIAKETFATIDSKDSIALGNANKDPILKETSPARSMLSRSGSEVSNDRPEDTNSEQNCTTSEDNEANPPSLCSDLPENSILKISPQIHTVAKPHISEESLSSKDSKEFPSPPSSMLEATTTTATQECRTEVTQIGPDSLFLEVTPTELDDENAIEPNEVEFKGTAGQMTPEDSGKNTHKASIKVDKIPYDMSISSENEVTNNQETQEQNSEGSLHDSMEILEEIATEDHFERELDSEEEYEDDDGEKDIFEMPPISSVVPIIHTDIEQQQPEQNYPQIVEHLDEEITQSNAEQEGQHMIHPFTQDQEQIQQLRLHQHSPNCRPPKPNGSGDEFIF